MSLLPQIRYIRFYKKASAKTSFQDVNIFKDSQIFKQESIDMLSNVDFDASYDDNDCESDIDVINYGKQMCY